MLFRVGISAFRIAYQLRNMPGKRFLSATLWLIIEIEYTPFGVLIMIEISIIVLYYYNVIILSKRLPTNFTDKFANTTTNLPTYCWRITCPTVVMRLSWLPESKSGNASFFEGFNHDISLRLHWATTRVKMSVVRNVVATKPVKRISLASIAFPVRMASPFLH